MAARRSLIIPVENQVRELDPKLLLACVAARSGFSSILGSRAEIDFRVSSFAPGLYLAKSMTDRSRRMFGILTRLGHEIVCWDEEALVHHPPEVYFTRRLSPESIGHVSHLLAWGEDNAQLFRAYPKLPDIPIHVTGNPRGDLLRPELRGYFARTVAELREQYGEFVLVNTNFGVVNAYVPILNLFLPARPGVPAETGRAAIGMTRAYAEAMAAHRQTTFDRFRDAVPRLAERFPDLTVLVRPHPVERHEAYTELANAHPNIRVDARGNVIPWLLAARAVIHNGCTTGLEAHALGVPAIAYRPPDSDLGINALPNAVSHLCTDPEELFALVAKARAGSLGVAGDAASRALVAHHLAAVEGPLASERIAEVLARIDADRVPARTRSERLGARFDAARRRLKKRLKARVPGSKNSPAFQRHRYPGLSAEELRERARRFQELLGDRTPLHIEALAEHVFRLSPGEAP